MVLSVIVPDNRPGMRKMLQRELDLIDSEVIFDSWKNGIAKAQGDFVCLLEYDSALTRDSIAQMLKPFLDNPLFRKLVMVSPHIEFDNKKDAMPVYQKLDNCTDYHLARYGSIAGSVIRKSSIKKIFEDIEDVKDILVASNMMSITFWESGLRIIEDPSSTYCTPRQFSGYPEPVFSPSEALQELWLRESV